MYVIELTIRNPITNETRVITKQFDPAAMTQNKWNGAFNSVKASMDELVSVSTPNEPQTW